MYSGKFPPALLLRTDHGSDWDLTILSNLVFMGRLWKDNKMDLLAMVSYAPHNSAFGIIEHDWAIVSQKLAGIIFDPRLQKEDGTREELPPQKQTKLAPEERVKKEAILFDQILEELESLYQSIHTAGFKATPHTIKCMEPSGPYSDVREWQSFLKLKTAQTANVEKLELVKCLVNHCVRWNDLLLFARCLESSDCSHCRSLPPIRAPNLLKFCYVGNKLSPPFPTRDPDNPEHFQCFSQIVHQNRKISRPIPPLSSPEYCDECNFVFTSVADKERHWALLHNGRPTKSFKTGQHKCHFIANGHPCNAIFDTQHRLNLHKEHTGHKLVRPKKATAPSSSAPKQPKKAMPEELDSDDENVKIHSQYQTRSKSSRRVGERVEVLYEAAGVEYYYCGTVLEERHIKKRPEILVRFDHDNVEDWIQSKDSQRPCPHQYPSPEAKPT